jgi:hypothetical protein
MPGASKAGCRRYVTRAKSAEDAKFIYVRDLRVRCDLCETNVADICPTLRERKTGYPLDALVNGTLHVHSHEGEIRLR